MRIVFLYVIVPAAAAFLVQTILCHKVKKGILRHGALIFTIIPVVVAGILLFTQCGGMFGGLGAVAAALWLINACCTVLGYGIAWLVYFITEKEKNRKKKDGGGL